jgi:hypothetical protein
VSLIPSPEAPALPLPFGIIPMGSLAPSSRSIIPLTTSKNVPSPPLEMMPLYLEKSSSKGILKLSPAF